MIGVLDNAVSVCFVFTRRFVGGERHPVHGDGTVDAILTHCEGVRR